MWRKLGQSEINQKWSENDLSKHKWTCMSVILIDGQMPIYESVRQVCVHFIVSINWLLCSISFNCVQSSTQDTHLNEDRVDLFA